MLVLAELNMTVKKNTTNDKSSHFKLMTIILEKALFLPVNSTFFFFFSISLYYLFCYNLYFLSIYHPLTMILLSTENVEIQEGNFFVFYSQI